MSKSKEKSIENTSKNGWAYFLSEAERELEAIKKRMNELHVAIRVFRTNIENGVPFPATGKTGQEAEETRSEVH